MSARRRRTTPGTADRRRDPVPAPPALGPVPAGHRLALAGLIAAYAVTFSILCWIRWRYYLYTDFDLAIFAQAVDGILRGTLFSSIRGMPWLGDHSSLILFVLAPIYAIVRHPMTLLVVQSVALALGALPIHALARRELRHDGLALACAALYLLQPAMGYANLFEFHPEMLATPALAAAFFFLRSGRTRATLVWAGFAMLCREDVALVVVMLALHALVWARPRRPALAGMLFAGAALSLAITFLILRPVFTHGESDYAGVYRQWGASFGSVVGGILSRPDLALQSLVITPGVPFDSSVKLQYHLTMLLPLAFLPLLSPATLLIALPAFAEHMLSWRTAQHTILCQYTALILPFTAVGTVMGMKNLLAWAAPVGRTAIVPRSVAATAVGAVALVASLFCAFLYGPLLSDGKFLLTPTRGRKLPTGAEVVAARNRDWLLARLPAHGGIVASFEILPRLSRRDSVHSIHHILRGTYTFSARPYPIPQNISGVIADMEAPNVIGSIAPGSTERIRALLSENRLVPVASGGDIVLFERGGGEFRELVSVGAGCDTSAQPIVFDGQLAWRGVMNEAIAEPGGTVHVRTCWERIATSDRFHGMELTLIDEAGRVRQTRRRDLGYVAWPPLSWPIGVPHREDYQMLLDDDLSPGAYTLRMRVIWRGINIDGESTSDSPDRSPPGSGVVLGRVVVVRNAESPGRR
jgi:uncharacterized membrane protein